MKADLRSCAARMIISGSWNNHTDKAIKEAWGCLEYPEHMIDQDSIDATIRYRDSGELRAEINRQLDAMMQRDVDRAEAERREAKQ